MQEHIDMIVSDSHITVILPQASPTRFKANESWLSDHQ